jgi:hypothetical protein
MGLDIRFISRRNVICPHCNHIIATEDVYCVDSGGRGWYDILEHLGYYVPHDQRTEENDWYGKDMVLTTEQAKQVYTFIRKHPNLYNDDEVLGLIATALVDENAVVINADW